MGATAGNISIRDNKQMDENVADGEITRFLEAWMRVRQMIQGANFNRFQKAGLSATQFMTLNLLPLEGKGLTLSELAARMNLGLATLTKTVDTLETRGMLTRTRSDVDRRLVHIALTEAGRQLQNAASNEFHDRMTGLFSTLDPASRKGLVDGLEALVVAGGTMGADRLTRETDGAPPEKRSAPRSRRR